MLRTAENFEILGVLRKNYWLFCLVKKGVMCLFEVYFAPPFVRKV